MVKYTRIPLVLSIVTAVLAFGDPLAACTRVMPISIEGLLEDADRIVRATASAYEVPAIGRRFRQGFQLGTIRFTVLETIKGQEPSALIVLPGVLTERDDFNDHEAPYSFVRPEGRHGDCGATAYRRGAEFLLFLEQIDGRYHILPEALAPVNEQLHDSNDAWLTWVKAVLATKPPLE